MWRWILLGVLMLFMVSYGYSVYQDAQEYNARRMDREEDARYREEGRVFRELMLQHQSGTTEGRGGYAR